MKPIIVIITLVVILSAPLVIINSEKQEKTAEIQKAISALQVKGMTFVNINPQGHKEYRHDTTGIIFVLIPGGTFRMGADNGYDDEKPMHEVALRDFLISKYEITQGQWKKIMNYNPSVHNYGDDYPVERVAWKFCRDFCKRTALRFPTEAEWEYACRAGTTTNFYWGDTVNGDYMWFSNNSDVTHAVGQKKPNGFGLYDMAGNVSEWCQDWYGEDYYKTSPGSNPQGPDTGSRRIVRGGAFSSLAGDCHSTFRNSLEHLNDVCTCSLGFRCARDLDIPDNLLSSKPEEQTIPKEKLKPSFEIKGMNYTGKNKQGYDEYQHEATGMFFVLIPGGAFNMGSDNYDNEKPVHQVAITGFLISKLEVAQYVWRKIMGNNPSCFNEASQGAWQKALGVQLRSDYIGDYPVETVSWNDCQEFCKKTGLRLPTEAEWEYACRAGTTTNFYWGDTVNGDYMWFSDNSESTTRPVGQKKPNGFGLYDMAGNVTEWCQDWYSEDYYKTSPANNPVGPEKGECRVLRGGSWGNGEDNCSSAARSDFAEPDGSNSIYGFRCVRDFR